MEEVSRRYLAPGELWALMRLPVDLRAAAFLACWTRKEAYVKAQGRGLHIPLDSFEVTLDPGEPPRFTRGTDPCWRLTALRRSRGFRPLFYDGSPANLRFLALDLQQ